MNFYVILQKPDRRYAGDTRRWALYDNDGPLYYRDSCQELLDLIVGRGPAPHVEIRPFREGGK